MDRKKRKAIVLNERDNVASALVDLNAGEEIDIEIPQKGSQRIALKEAIQLGHKFALQPIGRGAGVLKCGMSIGPATREIEAGEHVHIHNVGHSHNDARVQNIGNE